LDDGGRLTIKEAYTGDSALVSNLDEVVRFVGHCVERLERRKALKAQRGGCDRPSAIDYATFLGFFPAEPA
jgi:hypothetical protein